MLNGKGFQMFTLGTAAKHVGKSKPTISKAIKDGKLSAKKVEGVYQIDPSELTRVYGSQASQPPAKTNENTSTDMVALALAEQLNVHLGATVEDLKARLDDMKAERDQAVIDARESNTRVLALIDDRGPKASLWSRMFSR